MELLQGLVPIKIPSVMIRKFFQSLRRWRDERDEATDIMEKDNLASQFQIKELNGELYLTCDGTPYQVLAPDLKAEEIVARIREARLDALHHREQRHKVPHYITKTPTDAPAEDIFAVR